MPINSAVKEIWMSTEAHIFRPYLAKYNPKTLVLKHVSSVFISYNFSPLLTLKLG